MFKFKAYNTVTGKNKMITLAQYPCVEAGDNADVHTDVNIATGKVTYTVSPTDTNTVVTDLTVNASSGTVTLTSSDGSTHTANFPIYTGGETPELTSMSVSPACVLTLGFNDGSELSADLSGCVTSGIETMNFAGDTLTIVEKSGTIHTTTIDVAGVAGDPVTFEQDATTGVITFTDQFGTPTTYTPIEALLRAGPGYQQNVNGFTKMWGTFCEPLASAGNTFTVPLPATITNPSDISVVISESSTGAASAGHGYSHAVHVRGGTTGTDLAVMFRQTGGGATVDPVCFDYQIEGAILA